MKTTRPACLYLRQAAGRRAPKGDSTMHPNLRQDSDMKDGSKQFEVGDRVFSHYVMRWGTIEKIGQTTEPTRHGVTGSELPGSTWYTVRFDSGQTELLDDAHGDWEMARIVPPSVARRFGYGTDPKLGR